ncbi:hypothetical protein H4219_005184 [Mycoemilia scoparia]|uniref:C2 domain-containing protein n=1 Tax=Mycoemilia scoparia TaxID=417184 RepID=A0A9W7ZTY6_9FUNG|nr:hypothetical protein H4219_005184 [Mycoemilia scoparia]
MSSNERFEGTLKIYVLTGKDLPNRDRFGKQDVAVEFTVGTEKRRTKIDHKGGSNPRWMDTVLFHINGAGQTALMIQVLDVDTTKNDEVGSCVVDLRKVFVEEELDGWQHLKRKDKPAGKIYIEFTFEPKGGRKRLNRPPPAADVPGIPVNPMDSANAPVLENSSSSLASLNTAKHSVSSSNTAPASVLSASGQILPSRADLRPHSSAAMYRPEFAAQYATAHGKKPLPSTPPTGSPHLQPQQGTIMPGKTGAPSVMSLFSPPPSDPLPSLPYNQQHQAPVCSAYSAPYIPDFYEEQQPYNPNFSGQVPGREPYYGAPHPGQVVNPKPLPSLPQPAPSYYDPQQPQYPEYNPSFYSDGVAPGQEYAFPDPYPHAGIVPSHHQQQPQRHSPQMYHPSAPPLPSSYEARQQAYPYPSNSYHEHHQQQHQAPYYEFWH